MNRNTEDIQMYLDDGYPEEYLALSKQCRRSGLELIPWLERTLGPAPEHRRLGSQNRTFAVWDLGEIQILAHKVRGMCVEVPCGTSKGAARAAWERFRARFS